MNQSYFNHTTVCVTEKKALTEWTLTRRLHHHLPNTDTRKVVTVSHALECDDC